MMLSVPYKGFMDLNILHTQGCTKWAIGNMTNAPLEMAQTLVKYLKTKKGQICTFDMEEFGEGKLLLFNDNVYFENEATQERYQAGNVKMFASQFLKDVSSDVPAFANFYFAMDNTVQPRLEKELSALSLLVK